MYKRKQVYIWKPKLKPAGIFWHTCTTCTPKHTGDVTRQCGSVGRHTHRLLHLQTENKNWEAQSVFFRFVSHLVLWRYVSIYIQTRLYTHIHTHTCIHAYTHTFIHACTYTQVCTRTYIHTRLYTHIHTHTFMHAYTYTHVYTSINIHTRLYTHIHTHTFIHAYTYTHVYAPIYIHPCLYTHIHTYMFIHIYLHSQTGTEKRQTQTGFSIFNLPPLTKVCIHERFHMYTCIDFSHS